ncbi:MAG: hypothetical protein ABSH17_00610 [Syntrophobacteraceae bacterium]
MHLFFYKDFAVSLRIDGINHKISTDMTIVNPTPGKVMKKDWNPHVRAKNPIDITPAKAGISPE